MISLNYGFLEKLIAESKKDYKELALDMGLPEKFFTKLKEDGSNLSVGELCTMVDYFDVNIDELLTIKSNDNLKSKISNGRKYFSKYYEYEEKVLTMPPPDMESYKSSWVSDIRSGRAYTGSPEQFYVEKKKEYQRIMDIFATMENVLTSVVCSMNYSVPDKKVLRAKIIEYLVYGIVSDTPQISSRRIRSLASRACINLVDELEYKKLLKI